MKRFMLLACLAAFAWLQAVADFNSPDYAYPATVIADARRELAVTQRMPTRVAAVLQIARAKVAIDPMALPSAIDTIEMYASQTDDRAAKAMYLISEAGLIDGQLYRRYSSDLRGMSMTEAVAYTATLADSAASLAEGCDIPIKVYAPALPVKQHDYISCVGDYVAYKAAAILNKPRFYTKRQAIIQKQIAATPLGSMTHAYWLVLGDDANSILAAYLARPLGKYGAKLLTALRPGEAVSEAELVKMLREFIASDRDAEAVAEVRSRLAEIAVPNLEVSAPAIVAPGRPFPVRIEAGYIADITVTLRDAGGKAVASHTFPLDSLLNGLTDSVMMTAPVKGKYSLVCPQLEDRRRIEIGAADYAPLLAEEGSDAVLCIVDTDGHPLEDAFIAVNGKYAATTDHRGMARFNTPTKRSSITVMKGGRLVFFGGDLKINGYSKPKVSDYIYARFFISQPAYLPGDTVRWAAVLGIQDVSTGMAAPLIGRQVKVVMRDAAYEEVSNAIFTSDSLSRVSGQFAIPTDRLTGSYTLTVEPLNSLPRNWYGYASASFTVAEYKMPTIEITDLKATPTAESGLRVEGRVASFAGTGSEASVTVTAEPRSPWWWRRIVEASPASDTAVTDADGRFSVTIDSAYVTRGYVYTVTADAVTAAAEQAKASTDISLIDRPALVYEGPTLINMDDDEPLRLYLYSPDGTRIAGEATWHLHAPGNRVDCEGKTTVTPDGTAVYMTDLPAGPVTLTVTTRESEKVDLNLTLYSIKRNLVPDGESCFMPTKDYATLPDKSTAVLAGFPSKSTAYIFTAENNRILTAERREFKPGFHTLRIAPVAANRCVTGFISVYTDMDFSTTSFSVNGLDPDSLTLAVDSWRDRVTPGARESLTLRLTCGNGTPAKGAAVAAVYNRALSALGNARPEILSDLVFPGLNTYGRNVGYLCSTLNGTDRLYSRKLYIRGSMALGAAAENAFACADMANGAVEFTNSRSPQEAPADVRQVDPRSIASALWAPCLLTDDKGVATASFTFPEYNGSWQLDASAWDATLRGASASATATSVKPVMVQPNPPRYLRMGDSASIPVTVVNNSDEAAPATVTFASGSLSTAPIPAGGSVTVDIPLGVANSTPALTFWIKAAIGQNSDGEIRSIPVLPSDLYTLESLPFYLSPTHPSATLRLDAPTDAKGVLTYCANPVWEAVKAMPSFSLTPLTSSYGAAHRAFAAFTVDGLCRKFPQIPATIADWDAESLVSPLANDVGMKLATLQATPWTAAADAQTAERQKILLTFDPTARAKACKSAVDALRLLQRPDGGFVWGSWSGESSPFATACVLSSLGYLNRLGFMPDDGGLRKIVDKAFTWLEKHAGKEPELFASVAALLPDRKPATPQGRKAIESKAKSIVKHWRDRGVADRAASALYLDYAGYRTEARQIMKSISEMAVNGPDGAVSFPSVNGSNGYATILLAYTRIAPDSQLVDGVRRSLLMRTQAGPRLDTYDPGMLIAALLTTGTDWSSAEPDITAAADGQIITLPDAPYGSASAQLSSPLASTLTLTATGLTSAAYGAAMIGAIRPADEVPPHSTVDLSVTKAIDSAGDSLTVGDRVTVTITVTAYRDLSYVTLIDERSATLEPTDRVPDYRYAEGLSYYLEPLDSQTRFYINRLPRGVHTISYDAVVTAAGTFASGAATAQSQYAPELTARSGACRLVINPLKR